MVWRDDCVAQQISNFRGVVLVLKNYWINVRREDIRRRDLWKECDITNWRNASYRAENLSIPIWAKILSHALFIGRVFTYNLRCRKSCLGPHDLNRSYGVVSQHFLVCKMKKEQLELLGPAFSKEKYFTDERAFSVACIIQVDLKVAKKS